MVAKRCLTNPNPIPLFAPVMSIERGIPHDGITCVVYPKNIPEDIPKPVDCPAWSVIISYNFISSLLKFALQSTAPYSILITGANRGLGLGLVKHLLASNPRPQHVIATSRSLGGEKSKELEELAAKEACLSVVQLSVDDPATFSAAVSAVDGIVQEYGLNVLVNNAGIGIKRRLENVTAEDMTESFATNTIGPLMLTQSMLPLLKRAASRASTKPLGWEKAAIINMSSVLGSISANDGGGLYPYRCSKVALNAVTKSLSIDLLKDGIIACSVHPGWVYTDMGGSKAPVSVDESVQGMLKLFASLNQDSNGGFFKYDGTVMKW